MFSSKATVSRPVIMVQVLLRLDCTTRSSLRCFGSLRFGPPGGVERRRPGPTAAQRKAVDAERNKAARAAKKAAAGPTVKAVARSKKKSADA